MWSSETGHTDAASLVNAKKMLLAIQKLWISPMSEDRFVLLAARNMLATVLKCTFGEVA